jgi:Protein of unknown function (DUF3467)
MKKGSLIKDVTVMRGAATYANRVQVSATSTEMRIRFFDAFEAEQKQDGIITNYEQEILNIALAPKVAKELHIILGKTLRLYEKRFGKIAVAKGLKVREE